MIRVGLPLIVWFRGRPYRLDQTSRAGLILRGCTDDDLFAVELVDQVLIVQADDEAEAEASNRQA